MSNIDRKAKVRAYKETPRPAGVFRVRNVAAAKSYVGSSTDLPGMLNRQRFQLKAGGHPDRDLQRDWNDLGPDAFVFEVLDELPPKDDPAYDPTADLAVLLEMCIDQLTAAGEQLYGRAK